LVAEPVEVYSQVLISILFPTSILQTLVPELVEGEEPIYLVFPFFQLFPTFKGEEELEEGENITFFSSLRQAQGPIKD